MEILKNYKLHAIALLVVIACELIGMQKFSVGGKFSIVIFPMLFAIVIGGFISYPKWKILSETDMKNAGGMLSATLTLMIIVPALDAGHKIPQLLDASFALLFQELGHLMGTIIFGLPLAILLGMKREAIGATYSLDREANIVIIDEKYGLSSPEGHGVMAMYICGTVFGAIWIGIYASIIASLGIFHPFALAMGSGVGSGSMLASASGVIIDFYPQYESEIRAYAAASYIMVAAFGVYFALFISLPLTEKLYLFLDKFRKQTPDSSNLSDEVQK